ncbi:DUF3017 domain-containing protein [Streptomyces sp. Ncost-T10-10d]|uniref:DUF3017 domain-containing protein n=1 Tax=Streptomyces sp. Ncost-T10-10d TaxID=1839774 RepID=UPI00081ED6FA|nr:DUF3017 domain-containing protein [Streptomyces sp. Ncost-T10-10d]SCF96290.1 Protein of unknown function [Streptomyces sp. Ncost-T10-10d]
MGAGTSPADPAAEADRTSPVPPDADVPGAGAADEAAPDRAATREGAASEGAAREGAVVRADADRGADADEDSGGAARDEDIRPEAAAVAGSGSGAPHSGPRPSRRFPSFTRDTARPEGGGRAASGDAPAPARQWPLLAVLCTAGIGLLIVAVAPFAEAFRIGTMLIGVALIGGAVLRVVLPSVGMLAVRSRFTDLVTYGLLGFLIVMLALVAQPKPWLDIPFLEDAVHFTIR